MKKNAAIVLLAFACFFGIVYSANSETNVFLHIDGIKGESIDSRHKDQIDILNWTWELSHDYGSSTPPDVGPIIVTKYIDKASPFLNLFVLIGKKIKEAKLFLEKDGKQPFPYLRIEMSDVMISKVSHGGMSSDYRFTESVSLEFNKVCYIYTPQKLDGNPDAEIEKCFDMIRNRWY